MWRSTGWETQDDKNLCFRRLTERPQLGSMPVVSRTHAKVAIGALAIGIRR